MLGYINYIILIRLPGTDIIMPVSGGVRDGGTRVVG